MREKDEIETDNYKCFRANKMSITCSLWCRRPMKSYSSYKHIYTLKTTHSSARCRKSKHNAILIICLRIYFKRKLSIRSVFACVILDGFKHVSWHLLIWESVPCQVISHTHQHNNSNSLSTIVCACFSFRPYILFDHTIYLSNRMDRLRCKMIRKRHKRSHYL